jgi:hypothetical protein
MPKPLWSDFNREYPDYVSFDSAAVKRAIGGEVNEAWITNTCAVRMSRGLNYSKLPVPATFSGLHTAKGGDGKRYGFRVREMRLWLPTASALGAPDLDIHKAQGDAFDKATIKDMKGIIAFDIHFSDATGHLDRWYGQQFSHESGHSTDFGDAGRYWALATRITLWALH